jgi:sensor histidine kinase YesM
LEKIQLESDLRWSQQNALKAQMNPHFLFNILNSIKGYIYENDKANAIKYLSDFSSLVRDVLELSSLSYVSLEKELQFIKVYIALEAMLLEDDFEYHINVSEAIDTSYLQIPTLLLQPFVENSFKHGLRFQKGRKKLELNLRISEETDELIIDVIDNGIGREQSTKIYQSSDKRTSFATNAINQRIELLNQEIQNSIQVTIFDLKDTEDNNIGTQVQLQIKLTNGQ